MIRGKVVGLHAYVGVVFRLPNKPDLQIEFVIDTDFEGALTLPPAAVAALGLAYHARMHIRLADGSGAYVRVHQATVLWEGRAVNVAVLATGGPPLLGTALLDGFNLNVDFADGGDVTLRRLP